MDLAQRKKYFLEIFGRAQKKYGKSSKRLAADGWGEPWRTLIVTIMSAQSRDETTIPIAEKLFKKYDSLEKLANAKVSDVYRIFSGLNFNKTKAKNVIAAARHVRDEFSGVLSSDIDELVKIPGVGRKTANLVLSEVFGKDAIPIDTHCHRILNVLGIVDTKNPDQTEEEIKKIAPRKYWSKINRILVLWGKECPGRDKERLLGSLENRGGLSCY